MKDPKISVIVPVYNTEKYLDCCLQSILSQTFTDFELLLINDGSTDRSGEICDEYAKWDERVRVFHKENGGVSSARNLGLNEARGEWIAFVDADDELPKEAFCLDYDSCKEDLIIGGFYDNSSIRGCKTYGWEEEQIINKEDLKPFYAQNLSHPIMGFVWGKLFRKSAVYYIRFNTDMRIGEDTLYVLQCLNVVNACRTVKSVLYKYNVTETYHSKYEQPVEASIYCISNIFEAYKQLGIRSKILETRIFTDYKRFCQKAIYQNPDLWYKNNQVKQIYRTIKRNFFLKYRVCYVLMSVPAFSKLVCLLRTQIR